MMGNSNWKKAAGLTVLCVARMVFGTEGYWAKSDIGIVPNSPVCESDLAMDPDGTPVVVYLQEGDCPGPVMASWDQDHWRRESILPVCLPSPVCGSSSALSPQLRLAIDSHGWPHIVFQTLLEGAQYSSKTDTGWVHETISTSAAPFEIAVDPMDLPQVLLYSSPTTHQGFATEIFHSVRRQGGWDTKTALRVDGTIVHYQYVTLALDSLGVPYFAVAYQARGRLFKGQTDGTFSLQSSWSAQPQRLGLAIDRQDRAHVVFGTRDIPTRWAYAQAPDYGLTTSQGYGSYIVTPSLAISRSGRMYVTATTPLLSYGEGQFQNLTTETFTDRETGDSLNLGREDRPYLLVTGELSGDLIHPHLFLMAKMPPAQTLEVSTKTTHSITCSWEDPGSVVTGFRLRRKDDNADLSGILPGTSRSWTLEGLDPNARAEFFLETIFPGFVLPSTSVVSHTLGVRPGSPVLSRTPAGALAVSWSAGDNTPGTQFLLEFHNPEGNVSSHTVSSPNLLTPQDITVPQAVNITTLGEGGPPIPMVVDSFVRVDHGGVRAGFTFPDGLEVETFRRGTGSMGPLFSASREYVFPPWNGREETPTGEGFQLVSDAPLGQDASATVTVSISTETLNQGSRTLFLARYSPRSGAWVHLPSWQDGPKISGLTEDYGLFQIFAANSPPQSIHRAEAYPNPFRPSTGSVLWVRELPLDARVTISSASGRRIKNVDADANGFAQWDGNGDDGDPVPSGVYVLSIEQGGNRKKIKIMVER